ncbi:MAG: hypothetical protein WCT32_04265 [Patescibacteria group bacterium]|jgi:hypothetical protein
MKEENKNIEKRVEEDIEQHEKELVEEIETEIDKELDQEIERDVKDAVSRDVKEVIREKVEERLAERGISTGSVESQSKMRHSIGKYRHELAICWSGTCRYIAAITAVTYLIISGLIVGCRYLDLGFCLNRSFTGGVPYIAIVAVAGLISAFGIALLSVQPRIALIFLMIMSIPMLFLFLALIVQYVGAIIAGAIVLYLVLQFFTRRY